MEVELERKNARWVYEIKVLGSGGLLVILKVDASTGTILTRNGRDGTPTR
jgi:uncharacterized membrane protein YkoI